MPTQNETRVAIAEYETKIVRGVEIFKRRLLIVDMADIDPRVQCRAAGRTSVVRVRRHCGGHIAQGPTKR